MNKKISIISKSYVDKLGNLFFDVSYHDGDTVMEKRVPIVEYLQMFQDSLEIKENYMTIPRLPDSVLTARVSTSRADTFDAVVFFKSGKRAFSFMEQHYYIPFPALISQISVVKGVRKITKMYALKTDEPVKDTPLMQYPFGNVDNQGFCCYGNIAVQNIRDLSCAPEVITAFLDGATNNDYWSTNKLQKKISQGDLIEMLVKKKTFPISILKPSKGTVRTLCDFPEK